MCHMDEKKSPLELKILYLGIGFLFLQELVLWFLCPLDLCGVDDLELEGLILPHQWEWSFWGRSPEVRGSPEDRQEPPSPPSPFCVSVSGLVHATEGRGNVILELNFCWDLQKAEEIDSHVVLPLYCDCLSFYLQQFQLWFTQLHHNGIFVKFGY